MSHGPDDFLTVNEAARILRVSATTVRNWAADGTLEEHRTARWAPPVPRERRAAPRPRRWCRNRQPRVLVIDDDAAIRYVLREAFTSRRASR